MKSPFLPLLLEEFQKGNEMIWFMLVAFWKVNGVRVGRDQGD